MDPWTWIVACSVAVTLLVLLVAWLLMIDNDRWL